MRKAVVIAWNSLDGKKWQEMSRTGDPLERYRGRMMLAMMDEGKIEEEISEMTRAILEEIIVDGDVLTVRLLDGSEVRVKRGE